MAPLPFEPEYLFLGIVFAIGAIILAFCVLKSRNNYEKFQEKPLFYMFYTEWCGYSQKMLPVWESLKKQKIQPLQENTLEEIIDFRKINCEANEDTKKMCSKFKVKYLPTLIFMGSDGEPKLYRGSADLNALFEFTKTQVMEN